MELYGFAYKLAPVKILAAGYHEMQVEEPQQSHVIAPVFQGYMHCSV